MSNLIDMKFIDCFMMDGSYSKMNLKEILCRSKDIKAISGETALIRNSSIRFIISVVSSILRVGENDEDKYMELYNNGFPEDDIKKYLDKHYKRFDLYDEERPFYQVSKKSIEPYLNGEDKYKSLCVLKFSQDNNSIIYDHLTGNNKNIFSDEEIARNLIAYQTWSLCGGKSSTGIYSSSSPSNLFKISAIFLGKNLHETIMFNLCRVCGPQDIPSWESAVRKPRKERIMPSGNLDTLTWQSRFIHIDKQSGKMFDGQGAIFCHEHAKDPLALIPLEDISKDKKGKRALLEYNFEKGMWVNFHAAMMRVSDYKKHIAIKNIRTIENNLGRINIDLAIYAFDTDKGKILGYCEEFFPYSQEFIGIQNGGLYDDLVYVIKSFILKAEKNFLSITDFLGNIYKNEGDKDKNRLKKKAGENYWQYLESEFKAIISEIVEKNGDIDNDYILSLKKRWYDYLNNISIKSCESIFSCIKNSGERYNLFYGEGKFEKFKDDIFRNT